MERVFKVPEELVQVFSAVGKTGRFFDSFCVFEGA
jgi:hypothetical protein